MEGFYVPESAFRDFVKDAGASTVQQNINLESDVSDQFLYDFYTTINEIAVTQGVSYYDYSHDERFETNLQYFGDADHLNPKGAIYFTNLLLEEIPELNTYLSSH